MAAKNNSKKKAAKKPTDKKIIKEVAEQIIEREEETKEVELDPPVETEALEEVLSMDTEVVEKKEPEYEPTAEQIEEAIEVMNGDPSVVVPLNETFEIQEKAMENTFRSLKDKKKSKIDIKFKFDKFAINYPYGYYIPELYEKICHFLDDYYKNLDYNIILKEKDDFNKIIICLLFYIKIINEKKNDKKNKDKNLCSFPEDIEYFLLNCLEK